MLFNIKTKQATNLQTENMYCKLLSFHSSLCLVTQRKHHTKKHKTHFNMTETELKTKGLSLTVLTCITA